MVAKRFNQKGNIVILSETTDEPLSMMGYMAGVCWGADVSSNEKNKQRGLNCIRSNHGRVLEYPQIYMVIDGYSARVIREFCRHIGGLPTYLQESTRYVDMGKFNIVTPPSIKTHSEALEIYNDIHKEIQKAIVKLEDLGIPKEDAALLCPLGMETKIVYRTNLRTLVDMSRVRLCGRAYHEFRKLFKDIMNSLSIYSDEWAFLVNEEKIFKPKCEVLGYCEEVKGCGRKEKKNEKEF